MDLIEQVAIVSGAGRGIGRAVAEELSKAGAHVVVCARTDSELQDVATMISSSGGSCTKISADLSTIEGIDRVAREVLESTGPPDILVNNVGGEQPKHFADLKDEDWLESFELNFFSAVRMTRYLAPGMIERSSGAIVNIASTCGREPLLLSAPYSAAKAAMINYSKVCSDAYAPFNVRVNCVVPGVIETSATSRNAQISMERTGKSEEEVMRAMLKKHPIPVGRIGRPEEVAAMVHMLASPCSTYITGTAVYVDGGAHRSA